MVKIHNKSVDKPAFVLVKIPGTEKTDMISVQVEMLKPREQREFEEEHFRADDGNLVIELF